MVEQAHLNTIEMIATRVRAGCYIPDGDRIEMLETCVACLCDTLLEILTPGLPDANEREHIEYLDHHRGRVK